MSLKLISHVADQLVKSGHAIFQDQICADLSIKIVSLRKTESQSLFHIAI